MNETFSVLGLDCTAAFEDIGHSQSAYDMLKDFHIGELVESKSTSGSCSEKIDACATKIGSSSCCSSSYAKKTGECKPGQ